MRKILITENQEKLLVGLILKEAESDQNNEIQKYLDQNFLKTKILKEIDGVPKMVDIAVWFVDGKPVKSITPESLFRIVQNKFKSLCGDEKMRDERIRENIFAWFETNGYKYNKTTGNIIKS